MRQKERLLMYLVRHLYNKYRFGEKYDYLKRDTINIGDLVICATSGIHEWTVAFVEERTDGGILISDEAGLSIPWVLREIGTGKLLNMYNEMFNKIDTEKVPSYLLISDEEYLIYEKVIKAFRKSNDSYTYRYSDIHFDKNKCTVDIRKVWESDTYRTITFEWNKKTTIKSITNLIDECIKNLKEGDQQ